MNTRFICLILFVLSCAKTQEKTVSPTTSEVKVKLDRGNIVVWANRIKEHDRICFEIKLKLKRMDQKYAYSSNWNLAWIDEHSKYHLLNLTQRDPASIPRGISKKSSTGNYQVWASEFRACALSSELSPVQSIVLIPKNLPSPSKEKIVLQWNSKTH